MRSAWNTRVAGWWRRPRPTPRGAHHAQQVRGAATGARAALARRCARARRRAPGSSPYSRNQRARVASSASRSSSAAVAPLLGSMRMSRGACAALVLGEAEAALGGVELQRRHAEVEQHARRRAARRSSASTRVSSRNEACTRRHARAEAARAARRATRERLGVAVEADQPPVRRRPREDRFGVAAGPDGAVHHDRARLAARAEQGEALFEEDGLVGVSALHFGEGDWGAPGCRAARTEITPHRFPPARRAPRKHPNLSTGDVPPVPPIIEPYNPSCAAMVAISCARSRVCRISPS